MAEVNESQQAGAHNNIKTNSLTLSRKVNFRHSGKSVIDATYFLEVFCFLSLRVFYKFTSFLCAKYI